MKKTSTKFNRKVKFKNNFEKIVIFYLFESPAEGKWRGKTFKELGYYGGSSFKKLKQSMIASSKYLSKECVLFGKNEKELDIIFSGSPTDIIGKSSARFEYIIVLKQENKEVYSIYKAIRNSLAHGSFNQFNRGKVRYYYFENFDKYLKAKICLSEETLTSWIKLFE